MFGYIPDKAHSYTRFLSRFRAPAATPRDLRASACKVLDQGGSSSCTGHGTATGLYTACAVAGHPLGWIPSPKGIYTNGVAIDRADALSGPLLDQGAMPNQVARALSEFGVRPMRDQNALTDCDFSGTIPEPTLDELEADGEHVYVGWYAIANADEARIALAAGCPVGKGTFVDSHYMDWRPGDKPVGLTDENDPRGGGHWTVLLASNSGGTFWDRSSWGTSAGDNGEFLVTDAHVNQASQLIAFGYRRVGA